MACENGILYFVFGSDLGLLEHLFHFLQLPYFRPVHSEKLCTKSTSI